jgi:hypothetical protein
LWAKAGLKFPPLGLKFPPPGLKFPPPGLKFVSTLFPLTFVWILALALGDVPV